MQAIRKDLGVRGCDCKSECLQGIMTMLKDFIFDSKRKTEFLQCEDISHKTTDFRGKRHELNQNCACSHYHMC